MRKLKSFYSKYIAVRRINQSDMGTMKYGVFDSVGMPLAYFNTWKQAETFKISRGRVDWQIKQIWIK